MGEGEKSSVDLFCRSNANDRRSIRPYCRCHSKRLDEGGRPFVLLSSYSQRHVAGEDGVPLVHSAVVSLN